MSQRSEQFKLVRVPVPKGHRPRPGARITEGDRSLVRDYLACGGDVTSVREAHGVSRSTLKYALVKVGVWKRWARVPPPPHRCARCRRPLASRRNRYHAACRWKADAARTATVLKRARKLLAEGWTVRATAAEVGRSAVALSTLLPGVALTNEQRRRRGLPVARHQPPPPRSEKPRARAQRACTWTLVEVPVPPTHRGRPPEGLDAAERRAVKRYLACRGDVAAAARASGGSQGWLMLLLARAQIWLRWKKGPSPRPPCVVCGRPLPNLRPGHRHQACWEKEVAQQLNAWVPRAKALLAKGWTIGRVADELGVTAKRVREALPGHSRSAEVRVAESDARLRSFVRQVKAGCSVLEAGRRVGYAPNTARNARARAARKGLS